MILAVLVWNMMKLMKNYEAMFNFGIILRDIGLQQEWNIG